MLASVALGTGAPPDRVLAAIDAAQARTAALVTVRPERRAECAALLTTARASALLATDAPDAVLRDAARAALDACAAAGTERLRAGRLADLALLQALAGRLGEAEALATEYRALAEEWDVPRPLRSPTAALAAAWLCAARGRRPSRAGGRATRSRAPRTVAGCTPGRCWRCWRAGGCAWPVGSTRPRVPSARRPPPRRCPGGSASR